MTRTVCPANRRAVDIRITVAGLALLERIEQDGVLNASDLTQLNDAEVQQLNGLLDKIRSGDELPGR